MPTLATIATAAIGAGTAIYSSGQANKASKNALNAQNQATDQSLAAQQAALDRITSLNQPFIDAGRSVLPGLANRVNQGAPNFSSPAYARPMGYRAPPAAPGAPPAGNPAPANSGAKTYGGRVVDPASAGPTDLSSVGGPSGQVPSANGTPQTAATPQASGPNWDAYIAANPDVAAWIKQGHGDPNLGPNQTPEQAAAYQFHNTGQSEGRAAPPDLAPQQQGQDPNAPPPQPLDLGTASPVVADYARPDQGQAPNAADFFDQSKFQTSPDYQWRVAQGQRNLNASYGAKGLLKSGGAIQGAIDYGQHAASDEFQNWFNRQQTLYSDTANQFNINRNNTNNNFSEDRSYGTNLAINNRDFANNQYNTQTQNLFQLAGVGANAAAAVGGANNNYANNASNLYTNQGANAAQNAYNIGNNNAQMAGTIGSTVSNLFSSPSRYTGGTPLPLQSGNWQTMPTAANAPPSSMNFQAPITYSGGY